MGFGFASFTGPLHSKFDGLFAIILCTGSDGQYLFSGDDDSIFTIRPPQFAEHHAGSRILAKGYTAKRALRRWQFYALWLMLFINIFCGIAIISIASPMTQENDWHE